MFDYHIFESKLSGSQFLRAVFSILFSYLLEAVMMEFIIGSEGGKGAHAYRVSKEDLRRSVNPSFSHQKLVPIHFDIVSQTIHGAFQCQSANQKDEHHEVREEGGEPDNLKKTLKMNLKQQPQVFHLTALRPMTDVHLTHRIYRLSSQFGKSICKIGVGFDFR